MHPSAESSKMVVISSADMAEVSALAESDASSVVWNRVQLAWRKFHLRGREPKTGFSW